MQPTKQMGPQLVGVSENIRKIRDIIKHVANTGLNIVIAGETGVGKEVIAQNLYKESNRCGKPFLKVNCAALPEGLLESELYGYEKGAFTGADRKKKGKFELASGGVLFLDEIGDMPLSLQSKLLHVLQSGEFSPLGSERELRTDSWVIAATNQDLEAEIQAKRFREDLFYRLNTIKIAIAPLRERPEDIPPLIEYYLGRYTQQFNSESFTMPSEAEIHRLQGYNWPGNVRELQNAIKRILISQTWTEIIDDLTANQARQASAAPTHNPSPANPSPAGPPLNNIKFEGENSIHAPDFSLKKFKKQAVDRVERQVIRHVLDKTNWNRSKASKILKISYKTLLYKISELKITPQS